MLTQTIGPEGSGRYLEARRILYTMGLANKTGQMNFKERSFTERIVGLIDTYATDALLTPKALFYLRDLKEKYI